MHILVAIRGCEVVVAARISPNESNEPPKSLTLQVMATLDGCTWQQMICDVHIFVATLNIVFSVKW